MSTAPICYINPPPPSAEPVTPAIPAIPVATDLASAIQAINTLTRIVQQITNQNSSSGGGGSVSVKSANFSEDKAKRTTTVTRVFNQNDKTQYVDVKQITGLTFLNPVTKQTITWKQGDNSIPG